MSACVASLARSVEALPSNEDTAAALRFLKRTDLVEISPCQDELNFRTAEEWLKIYEIRRSSSDRAGLKTYGFESLLIALDGLSTSEPIAVRAFSCSEWHGAFWLNQKNELIGFALVARRTPTEEQERQDWFQRHMA